MKSQAEKIPLAFELNYLRLRGDCISGRYTVDSELGVYRREHKGKRWTMLGAETMNRVPLVSLVVFLFSVNPAQSQELQNGGFENQLTGWTQSVSGNGGVGVIGTGTEGYRSAKMVAISQAEQVSAVTLSQTFSAHSGDLLQFDALALLDLNKNGLCDVSISTLDWSVNPTIPFSVAYAFQSYSYVLPSDAAYTLSFRVETLVVGSESRAEMFVDNVRMTAVPEPGAFLLLGVGAAVFSAGCFKRKR
jgi:hypothetical protein